MSAATRCAAGGYGRAAHDRGEGPGACAVHEADQDGLHGSPLPAQARRARHGHHMIAGTLAYDLVVHGRSHHVLFSIVRERYLRSADALPLSRFNPDRTDLVFGNLRHRVERGDRQVIDVLLSGEVKVPENDRRRYARGDHRLGKYFPAPRGHPNPSSAIQADSYGVLGADLDQRPWVDIEQP